MRNSTWLLRLLVASITLFHGADADSPAGVYSGSQTPSQFPWNTYNYCNAPHVNAKHYSVPENSRDAQLVYLNVMMRHHKRVPDNLYPSENELNPSTGWDCTDFLASTYGSLDGRNSESAHIIHDTLIPNNHPFLSQIWNGNCAVGQLTAGGLEDAARHGQDFASVYMKKLKFINGVDEIYVRTSSEDRTYQTAGGMLYGMDPTLAGKPFKVQNQIANIDSLVPSYPCPKADAIRSQFQSVPAWTNHIEENADLQARLGDMLGTRGMSAWDIWYDHFFDTFTSRTCHGHPLPCNSSGACVSQADADRVHRLGDFEYNYIWKAAENATLYNTLTFSVMFRELADNLRSYIAHREPVKARIYFGHDGSMIRLASGLGIEGPLRWPGLGKEIVFEVWKERDGSLFVRVMNEGTPAKGLDWVPLNLFISILEKNVAPDVFDQCFS